MARIAGVNVPDNKHAVIALTAIYGIGRTTAETICKSVGVNASTRIKDLDDNDVEKLRNEIAIIKDPETNKNNGLNHTIFNERNVIVDMTEMMAKGITIPLLKSWMTS